MWVVVKFAEDVSAVLFSWIRFIEETGETMCFWPNKYAEKKRAKPNAKVDTTDGTLYPCQILFNGAKFDTLTEAIRMEIRGQEHSSAETNDESTSNRKTRKRAPKKRKITAKTWSLSSEASYSSDDSLSDTMEMCTYSFKRSKTIKMRDGLESFDAVVPEAAVESKNSNEVTIEVVTIKPAEDPQTSSNSDPSTANFDETPTANVAETDVNQDVEYISLSTIQVKEYTCDSLSNIAKVGDIIELPPANPNSENIRQEVLGNVQSTMLELLFKQLTEFSTKMDAINTKLNVMETKLDLVSSQQEGYKSVIVDLAAKILRLEDIVESKNTQKLTLSQELNVPMKCPESFTLNEAALLKQTTAENLVSYICSVNFQSELEPFIKLVFVTLFDMDFFYGFIIWSHEPGRICIKNTETLKVIVRSVKGRFPALQLSANQLYEAIYVAAKKLKDSHRKKPKNNANLPAAAALN